MGIHTADVIVLRRHLFRETSVVVSLLTDRYGRIKGLVKGLRGPRNRHRSAMEPLTVNRIVFYDTRNSQIHLVSQCELTGPLLALQRDLETARTAAFCAELAEAVTPLEDPQPAVYHLLKGTLERMALAGGDLAASRVHFIARLLRLTGFQPRVDRCASCHGSIHAGGFWSTQEGGLLCPDCLSRDPNGEPARLDILEAIELLSDSAQPPPLAPEVLPRLCDRLDEFLRWRLEKALKTMSWGMGQGTRGMTRAMPEHALSRNDLVR